MNAKKAVVVAGAMLAVLSNAASAQGYVTRPQFGPSYAPAPIYSQGPEYYAPPVEYYEAAPQAYYAPRAPYYYAYPPTYYTRPPGYYGRPAWRDQGRRDGRGWNGYGEHGRDAHRR